MVEFVRRRRWLKISLTVLAVLFAGLCVWLGLLLGKAWRPMGKMPTGERLARIERSERWDAEQERFRDILPRVEPKLLEIIPKWFATPHPYRRPTGTCNGMSQQTDTKNTRSTYETQALRRSSPPPCCGLTDVEPFNTDASGCKAPLPHQRLTRSAFETPPRTGLRITWLGHSTVILEIAGKRVLIDPVWGEYAAPIELENAQRFIPPPLPFEELPEIDAVVISHDHYDHLDLPTIERLAQMDVPFFVPLGVGSHLEYWGVPVTRITEHEWWEESALGELTIACTPARHFSGRSGIDRDKTLWASWAFVAPDARVYFSGDTALFPGFEEIGDKYGPFDVTMLESGAYNQMWADVHLGPEQAITAHQLLGGGLLLPIHWGMFDLGLHGWTEPIERILIAAEKADVDVATLRPGESIEPKSPPPQKRWWPDRPYDTFEEAPVVSFHLPESLRYWDSQ